MNSMKVDVAVIGAGTAGLAAYRAARTHGKRVVLIEGGPYGTTCARVGCMPSKLLIAAADAAHAIRTAPAFGVHGGEVRIDGRAVMARVRAERDRFVGFVLDGIERMPEADKLQGHARFIGPLQLQIDDKLRIDAAAVVIATGSSPLVPAPLQSLGDRAIVNDDVFEWQDLPESAAVVGSGVIGLELGLALRRLGVRVAIFGRGTGLAHLSDPAVLNAARQALAGELDLRAQTAVVRAAREGKGIRLVSRAADGVEREEVFDLAIAAAGRTPNVEALDLQKAGLQLDTRGVPHFDPFTRQCGNAAVFIAGDVSVERPVLHEAADQGRAAGDNAGRYPAVQAGLRRAALAIAFTDPQLATVGLPYRGLAGRRVVIGEVSFEDQGRSRVMLQNRGLLRIYAELDSGRLLGAEMAGPRAEHLGHLLAWACQSEMTVEQMLLLPFYHPVVEEGLRTALRDALEKLRHGLPAIEHCTDCTPGV
jgi:dihydrolipoamide dehydrogenase